ncbi:hypothetical protein M422DRAFT_45374 [Sphaerobolus stellatus SS14]|nr:hypothetical protein M422DRAFT_45374 [Sphaerobolus stellatus SS14]
MTSQSWDLFTANMTNSGSLEPAVPMSIPPNIAEISSKASLIDLYMASWWFKFLAHCFSRAIIFLLSDMGAEQKPFVPGFTAASVYYIIDIFRPGLSSPSRRGPSRWLSVMSSAPEQHSFPDPNDGSQAAATADFNSLRLRIDSIGFDLFVHSKTWLIGTATADTLIAVCLSYLVYLLKIEIVEIGRFTEDVINL